jgi:hypothetical protein
MQSALECVENWYTEIGLFINADKLSPFFYMLHWTREELKNAQKKHFHLQLMTYLRIIGGMLSKLTTALEVILM